MICTLLGDLNVDLLQVDTDIECCDYYDDLLASPGFKPLIMQPTRVMTRSNGTSATLIDNIFVNDIETRSVGGNITTSLSDHFPQFSILDILEGKHKIKEKRYGRSYKNYNNDEFKGELQQINWEVLFFSK